MSKQLVNYQVKISSLFSKFSIYVNNFFYNYCTFAEVRCLVHLANYSKPIFIFALLFYVAILTFFEELKIRPYFTENGARIVEKIKKKLRG